jgi:homoserine dehydrogenase
MKDVKGLKRVAIAGFGVVGRGLAKALVTKKDVLIKRAGDYRIAAICDSKGGIYSEEGVDVFEAIRIKEKEGRLPEELTVEDIIDRIDILFECTPTNVETGEPGLSHIKLALENGVDVITSNKGPLVVGYKELMKTAKKTGAKLMYEATVGGAMPIIKLVKNELAGNEVLSIKGILNGTCNYILSRMEQEKMPYSQILSEAQELGIAEADPTYDVEGIDAAAKLVILANSLMNSNATFSDVERTGISSITPEAFEIAAMKGYTIRLIAEATRDELRVSPRLVPFNSPLCVYGTLNAALIQTDLAGEVVVMGRGAGSSETASAMLSDFVELSRCGSK